MFTSKFPYTERTFVLETLYQVLVYKLSSYTKKSEKKRKWMNEWMNKKEKKKKEKQKTKTSTIWFLQNTTRAFTPHLTLTQTKANDSNHNDVQTFPKILQKIIETQTF